MSRSVNHHIGFRKIIQLLFTLVSLYVGWQFINFYRYLESSGLAGSPLRPSAVEAFIPLSALVGLRSWLGTGIYDIIHPAGLTILLTAILISFLFRKSFCSWICPFGFLEDVLSKLGSGILPKKISMPRWLDIPLRSIKYILLALFVGSIFLMMSSDSAVSFLNAPYNKMADIKMLQFFLNISLTGILVFAFLIIMSVFFEHFWCRYLCPYGALLGIVGWFSPARISRNELNCINCGACDRVCPGILTVSKANNVISPECNSCLSCIDKCPADGALKFHIPGIPDRKYALPAAMLITFAVIIIAAKAAGYWKTSVTTDEMQMLYSYMDMF